MSLLNAEPEIIKQLSLWFPCCDSLEFIRLYIEPVDWRKVWKSQAKVVTFFIRGSGFSSCKIY